MCQKGKLVFLHSFSYFGATVKGRVKIFLFALWVFLGSLSFPLNQYLEA